MVIGTYYALHDVLRAAQEMLRSTMGCCMLRRSSHRYDINYYVNSSVVTTTVDYMTVIWSSIFESVLQIAIKIKSVI